MSTSGMFSTSLWAVCGIVIASGLALGADSTGFVGTWALNPSKSNFGTSTSVKSQQMVVTDADEGKVKYSIDWVEHDGKPGHVEYTGKADGKPYPIANSAEYDTLKAIQLNSHAIKYTLLKNGAVVESGIDSLSKDQKIMKETNKGTEDGKPYTQHLVFERQ